MLYSNYRLFAEVTYLSDSMPTKCCWVIHGSLTSERKASTFPSSFIHTRRDPAAQSSAQAPSSLSLQCHALRSSSARQAQTLGQRAVEVIICMITRDFSVISMTSQASLSLSLPLRVSQKSLTHNTGSASALPIIFTSRS